MYPLPSWIASNPITVITLPRILERAGMVASLLLESWIAGKTVYIITDYPLRIKQHYGREISNQFFLDQSWIVSPTTIKADYVIVEKLDWLSSEMFEALQASNVKQIYIYGYQTSLSDQQASFLIGYPRPYLSLNWEGPSIKYHLVESDDETGALLNLMGYLTTSPGEENIIITENPEGYQSALSTNLQFASYGLSILISRPENETIPEISYSAKSDGQTNNTVAAHLFSPRRTNPPTISGGNKKINATIIEANSLSRYHGTFKGISNIYIMDPITPSEFLHWFDNCVYLFDNYVNTGITQINVYWFMKETPIDENDTRRAMSYQGTVAELTDRQRTYGQLIQGPLTIGYTDQFTVRT